MADGKTVKIIVAAHKAFRMPDDDMSATVSLPGFIGRGRILRLII